MQSRCPLWAGCLTGFSEIREGCRGAVRTAEGRARVGRVSSGRRRGRGRAGGCGDPGRLFGGPPRALCLDPPLPSLPLLSPPLLGPRPARGLWAGGAAGGVWRRQEGAGGSRAPGRKRRTHRPTRAPRIRTFGSRHVGSPARLGRLRACRRCGSGGARSLHAGTCAARYHRGPGLDPGPAEQPGTAARGEG